MVEHRAQEIVLRYDINIKNVSIINLIVSQTSNIYGSLHININSSVADKAFHVRH